MEAHKDPKYCVCIWLVIKAWAHDQAFADLLHVSYMTLLFHVLLVIYAC
jgi:hypothetical protein